MNKEPSVEQVIADASVLIVANEVVNEYKIPGEEEDIATAFIVGTIAEGNSVINQSAT